MRVVVVLPRGSDLSAQRPNSIETVVRTLAGRSRAWRETLTLICDEGPDTLRDPRILTLPAGLSSEARIRAAAERIRSLEPDLVEHHQHLAQSAGLARRLPGTAHLFYRHTRVRPPQGPLSRWRYERRLAAFDRLVFVSEWARLEFCGDYPGMTDRTTAIPNPIEYEDWRGDPLDREKLILFSGRAIPDKGLDLFCTALARTLDARADWRAVLLLAEWDRSRAWAEPHVQALQRFGDRIELRLCATRSEVRSANRRAAIAVIPSRIPEALGLTALEAHAGGAAVLSSGRGGLREASGDHAIFAEPEPAVLGQALLDLVDDEAGRLRLGRLGQEAVAMRHDAGRAAADLAALRRDICGQRAARRATPGAPGRLISRAEGALR